MANNPPTIVQSTKHWSAYQVRPLALSFPNHPTTGNRIAAVIHGQKSESPFNAGTLASHTPAPTVTDNSGTVYTLVDNVSTVSQEANGVYNPDTAGYYSSLYMYLSAPINNNVTSVLVSSFYPDETNIANVNGRPVFDGGIYVDVFEITGIATGVDKHGHYTGNAANMGASLITTTGAALILEAGLLIDSSSLTMGAGATPNYSHLIPGGVSHVVTQNRVVNAATANSGFINSGRYTGSVVSASFA